MAFAVIAVMIAACGSQAQTTLWPLGDSITYGEGVPGGYRDPLFVRLGVDRFGGTNGFRFVGTCVINPSPTLTAAAQTRHEGHRGYRIDQISTNLDGSDNSTVYDDTNHGGYWLTGGPGGTLVPSTDVILLMIGTNDFLQNRDLAHATDRLAALVGKLTTLRPTANVLVANIPPLSTSIYGSHDVSAFNESIPGVVKTYADAGKHVWFVDQYSNFFDSGGDLRYLQGDGTHPDADGYRAMADTWGQALQALPEPNMPMLAASVLAGLAGGRGRRKRSPSAPWLARVDGRPAN
ncbi:MAG TPA: SGNH/GDSL hydrolase family protein [Tepidisphaeraceae bacterium]